MQMVVQYPTWNEVKNDLNEIDLIGFIDAAIDGYNINAIINLYIEENYEYELVVDQDIAYDSMRDDILTGDL